MFQECRHIKTSGTKCQAPALKDKAYCYFHFRAHQLRHRPVDRYAAFMKPKFQVPLLEDRGAIQVAISETVHALAQDHMDHKRAGRILYGLQLALACVKVPQEIVATQPVREIFQNEEGEDIAPAKIAYEAEDEQLHRDGSQGQDDADRRGHNQPDDEPGREDGQMPASPDPQLAAQPAEDNLLSQRQSPEHEASESPAGAPGGRVATSPIQRKSQETPRISSRIIAGYVAALKRKYPELCAPDRNSPVDHPR